MKKNIFCLSSLALLCSLIFFACKKNSSQANVDGTSKVTVQADDQTRVLQETDAVSNDADVALEASPSSITGREMSTQTPLVCDATIVNDTLSASKTITITYNGTNCLGSRTRTGVVVISLAAGVHWKSAGAIISLTYKNVKITRLTDNKSITINGMHTITNVSGGLLKNLPLQNITHTITSSNMSVTFDDGSQQTWQVARQRIFTYNNGIVISTKGIHVDGTNKAIEEWGTTRYGSVFVNSILEPMVIRQDCGFRLVSGTMKHETVLATTTAVFGLNASGDATSCPGSGNYYFKVQWTGSNGKIFTVILPY